MWNLGFSQRNCWKLLSKILRDFSCKLLPTFRWIIIPLSSEIRAHSLWIFWLRNLLTQTKNLKSDKVLSLLFSPTKDFFFLRLSDYMSGFIYHLCAISAYDRYVKILLRLLLYSIQNQTFACFTSVHLYSPKHTSFRGTEHKRPSTGGYNQYIDKPDSPYFFFWGGGRRRGEMSIFI